MELSVESLKTLADQLSCPNGSMGMEVANNMQLSNSGMIHHAIDSLSIQDDQHIVELGHGDGAHIASIIDKASCVSYSGLEVSALMHEVALKNTSALSESVTLSIYDGSRIPLANASVDVVFTVNTIYFWKDRIALLRSIFDVLKPGGKLCISFADKTFMESLPFVQYGFQLITVEELFRELVAAGFIHSGVDTQVENVIAKSGESVLRKYHLVIVTKEV